ncbi:MAG: chromosomal replication initiator protein DnaA [Myxococcota bacterium]
MQQVWDQIQDTLKEQVGPQNYEIWIRPIQLAAATGELIHLHVPNRYYRDWVVSNYGDTLKEAFQRDLGHPVSIRFLIGEEQPPETPTTHGNNAISPVVSTPPPSGAPRSGAPRSGAPPSGAPPSGAPPSGAPVPSVVDNGVHHTPAVPYHPTVQIEKTFSNFVVGACNQFAHAAAQAVCDQPGESQYNPLFIYGSTGLGKTHLLHAIGNHFLSQQPDGHVLYVTAEQFTNDVVDALRYRRMHDFRNRYRIRPSILLMDDVQFVSGKERTQEELFHTFEWLKERGRQIVFTSDVLPREIKGFEPRLRTRCESGMIADTQPPDMETMLAILHQKAEDMDLLIPRDLGQYIASRVRGNIRELEGVLKRLKALCELHQTPPTTEFARKYLGTVLADAPQALTAEEIIQTVASFFHIKVSDLKGKRRLKQYVRPRHLAMWLCREQTDLSFPDIGRAFGGRDHATVQHACKKVRKMLDRDADLVNTIKLIERSLGR